MTAAATTRVEQQLLTRLSYTVSEAAAEVGVSINTIRRALNAGDLRGKKLGAKVLVRREDLSAWLDSLPDA